MTGGGLRSFIRSIMAGGVLSSAHSALDLACAAAGLGGEATRAHVSDGVTAGGDAGVVQHPGTCRAWCPRPEGGARGCAVAGVPNGWEAAMN